MVDNDQLELFITGCFRIRSDAYYYAHECISENCLRHKNATHVYRAQGRRKTDFTKFYIVSYFIAHFNQKGE